MPLDVSRPAQKSKNPGQVGCCSFGSQGALQTAFAGTGGVKGMAPPPGVSVQTASCRPVWDQSLGSVDSELMVVSTCQT